MYILELFKNELKINRKTKEISNSIEMNEISFYKTS